MATFIDDLAEAFEAYESSREGQRQGGATNGEAGLSPQDVHALALLRAETLRVAALTAGSASIANEAARAPADRPATSDAMLLTPQFHPGVEAQLLALSESDALSDLREAWFAANCRLLFARELSGARAVEKIHPDLRPQIPADVVADAWCRSCASIRDFLRKLVALTPVRQNANEGAPEVQVIGLLDAAASGRWPCLDSEGNFSLPGWAERRAERRRQLVQPTEIESGDETIPAMTENISTRGMQITIRRVLPTGSLVKLYFADGRVIEARVRWSDGMKAGLSFETALDNDDPLWTARSRVDESA